MALVRSSLLVMAWIAFGLATACSGGGGGSDGGPTAALGAATAEDVAGGVVRTVVASGDIGVAFEDGMGGGGGGAGAAARKVEGSRGGDAPDHATRDPFGPDTEACAVSGDVTIQGDVADPDVISAGDFIEADFDLCDTGDTLLDGMFEFTVDSLTGTLFEGDYAAVLSIVFGLFSVDDGVTELMIDGDAELDLDFTVPLLSVTGVSGSRLEISDGVESAILTNYSTLLELDSDLDVYTVTASGRLEHSAFEGSVDFETSPSLSGALDADPDAGLLVIYGAADSFMHVIPDMNGVDVDLEINLDGEGPPEQLVQTTWDVLFGAL